MQGRGIGSRTKSRGNCLNHCFSRPCGSWVCMECEAGEYIYGVTCLDISEGDAPALLVRVGKDFDTWTVKRVQ